MHKRGKKYRAAAEKVERSKLYSLDEALKLIQNVSYAKFDETVELSFRLGIDPRHADQMVRGAIALPGGTGKTLKVCVIASGEKITEAEKAGADFAGGDDIITKIQGGWMDFDRMIATPDMMGKIGRIGRLLGPRGLMPNPKLGTVTMDVGKAVAEQKAGKVEYRCEKAGIVQVPVGKKSFAPDKLRLNVETIIGAIMRAKPASAKGTYLKSLTISTTMSPGIRINPLDVASIG
jgi:large subunit ribosomal protein L1